MKKTGKTGASSTSHVSPARAKRQAAARRRQDARWAAKSGPVVIIKPRNTG